MATIRDVLNDARQRIAPVSTSAGLDAQLLLAEVLDASRAHVLAHPEKVLTPEQAARYESLVARRERGEPVAYILQQRAFYDREFVVTPAVLIPRPETEHLLELALEFLDEHPNASVVDCGTGSGALAVTLAANRPSAKVYATDISAEALAVAHQNVRLHDADVTFFLGDLLNPLAERGIRVDLVMANLPYIASDELSRLEVSKFEPRLALDGGPDGLDLVRRVLEQAHDVCNPEATLLLEIGAEQGKAVSNLARDLTAVEVLKDYAGHDRVIRVRL